MLYEVITHNRSNTGEFLRISDNIIIYDKRQQYSIRKPMGNIEHPAKRIRHRITSYNVCYTKLLRVIHANCRELKNLNPLPDVIYLDPMYPHRSKSALVKKEIVITSYSIHYTKLYDIVFYRQHFLDRGVIPQQGLSYGNKYGAFE